MSRLTLLIPVGLIFGQWPEETGSLELMPEVHTDGDGWRVTTPSLNAAGGAVIIALAFPMVLGSNERVEHNQDRVVDAIAPESTWRTEAFVPFGVPLALVVLVAFPGIPLWLFNIFSSVVFELLMPLFGLVMAYVYGAHVTRHREASNAQARAHVS